MDMEQRLDLMARAEPIVKEAARLEGLTLHPLIEESLVVAVKSHHLTEPGVYRLVEALANVEREAGRLPQKSPVDYAAFRKT